MDTNCLLSLLKGLKKYDTIQLYDHIGKVCKGIMRGVKTEGEASFRLIRAVLREHLQQNGKVFPRRV